MRRKLMVAVFVAWAFGALAAVSQQPPGADSPAPAPAEVLVLGVYHMANPGRDIFNTQADDVSAPKRQAEIAELIEVLKRFQPTKIAVEAGFSNSAITRRYDDYVAGNHELTRNEVEQVGFRLAKELGHEAIYPVDVDGEFPYPRLVDYAKANGHTQEFEALMDEIGEKVEAEGEYLASHTVLETLLHMNSDDQVAASVGFDYRQVRFGEPWNWAGADLLSDWFHRNIRIYSNIVGLVDSPNERVLVVFGAGHLGWLQHNVSSDPHLRLRRLAEFAK